MPPPGIEPGTFGLRVAYLQGVCPRLLESRSRWIRFRRVVSAEFGTRFGTRPLVDCRGRPGNADSNALVVGNVAAEASNPLALGSKEIRSEDRAVKDRGTRLQAA